MELELFEADNGECPYLDNRRWCSYVFYTNELYESLLSHGFRRSGFAFYRNNCPGCKLCVPIRIMVNAFKPSKSQKRALKKNDDIEFSQHSIGFDEESFELYKKYSIDRFQTDVTYEGYRDFLTRSAVDTRIIKYHHHARLIGISWIDILPRSLSSVYFAFDPEFAHRSLGVYSILKEIDLAKNLQKESLHLGFWVRGCVTMKYKKKYNPHQLLINDEWVQC